MKLPKDLAASTLAVKILSSYQQVAEQTEQLFQRGTPEVTPDELKLALKEKLPLVEELTEKILAD